jgi:hypothetical protein
LRFAGTTVVEELRVVKTSGAYQVDGILARGSQPAPSDARAPAIAVARSFFAALQGSDKAAWQRFASPALLERSKTEPISAMLGVQNLPDRIDITSVRSQSSVLYVTAQLRFASTTIGEELRVVKTTGGDYRVDGIVNLGAAR